MTLNTLNFVRVDGNSPIMISPKKRCSTPRNNTIQNVLILILVLVFIHMRTPTLNAQSPICSKLYIRSLQNCEPQHVVVDVNSPNSPMCVKQQENGHSPDAMSDHHHDPTFSGRRFGLFFRIASNIRARRDHRHQNRTERKRRRRDRLSAEISHVEHSHH